RAFIFEFELPGNRRHCRVDVCSSRNPAFLPGACRALFGAAHGTLQRGDREPLAHTGAAVNALVLARLKRNLFHDLPQILGNFDLPASIPPNPRFLMRDGHTLSYRSWIVRADFRSDAILQRSDDFSAGGIVLRV